MYQYHRFPNGIRLIHKQQPGKVSHLGFFINAGSRDEDINEQGVAHFIEHLIFKGTEKRSNYQVLSRLENVGADLNAYTTKEDTTVYASIQNTHYQRAFELLTDIVFHSNFPDKEMEKERIVIMDELNSYKDNPAEWIYDSFDELLYPNHAIGKNILGTTQTLKKIKKESILHFYKKHYIPSQIVISSISNMSLKHVTKIMDKYLQHITTADVAYKREGVGIYTPVKFTKKYANHQAHVVIGNIAYNAHDKKRMPMALLNNILGGPAMSSRLNMRLREQNGIAYNLESNYQAFSDTGMFNIYCGTDSKLLSKAIDLIHNELKILREKELSSLQMHTAIKQLCGQLTISMESKQSEMLAMGKNMLVYDFMENVKDTYKRIEAITQKEVIEIANEVFNPSQLSELIFTH